MAKVVIVGIVTNAFLSEKSNNSYMTVLENREDRKRCEFTFQSREVDLSVVPLLVPVELTGDIMGRLYPREDGKGSNQVLYLTSLGVKNLNGKGGETK
jgi:hypothetical protein